MIPIIFSILKTRVTKPKLTDINPAHVRIHIYLTSKPQHTEPSNQGYNYEELKENEKNPYLFLEDWWLKWCKKGGFWEWHGEFERGLVRGKNWNDLKTAQFAQNTRFSWLDQVACKSPGPTTRTLKTKILKNFSKCFSPLEGLPARKSGGKPRKSLCNSCDWTFHPQTSHHSESRET